jgi:hypothetical protein
MTKSQNPKNQIYNQRQSQSLLSRFPADLKLILMHLSVRPLLVEENEDQIGIYVNSLYAFLEIRSNGIGYTGKKPPQWNNFESWAIVNGWTQSCREGFAHGGIGSTKYMVSNAQGLIYFNNLFLIIV